MTPYIRTGACMYSITLHDDKIPEEKAAADLRASKRRGFDPN